jgi:hypothetical protein
MRRRARLHFFTMLGIAIAALLCTRAERAEAGMPIDEPPIDLSNASVDCDRNGVEDRKQLDGGTAKDSDGDGLLDECELVPGDVDLDRDVDETDGILLSRAVGSIEGLDSRFSFGADLNRDHVVNAVDVTIWGRSYHDATGARFECSDHYDNDGDGQVDFPADPGCGDAVGKSERAARERPASR